MRSLPSWLAAAMPLSTFPSLPTEKRIDRARWPFHRIFTSYSPGFSLSTWAEPTWLARLDRGVPLLSHLYTLGKMHATRAHLAFCGRESATASDGISLTSSKEQAGRPVSLPAMEILPTS